MSNDFSLAAIPAIISVSASIGIAYAIFKNTISKKYGESRKTSSQSKFLFWVGTLCCLILSQGIMKIFNEILFSLFNSTSIKNDNIIGGLVIGFIVPAIIYLPSIFFIKLFGGKNPISNQIQQTIDTKSNYHLLYAIGAVAIFLIGGFVLKEQGILSNEKTITISNCEQCRNNECKPYQSSLKKIKIEENKIIFFIEKDGELTLRQAPESDETCTIVKSENYAFNCISKSNNSFVINGLSFTQSFSRSYNGADKYTWAARFHTSEGEKIFDKSVCSVK